jgi:hypothetical protein
MKYFKIIIDETGCSSPKGKDESRIFNQIVERQKTIEGVEEFLKDRYGKVISKQKRKQNGVFIDRGNESEQIGFHYSFWNKDYSHNSKKWFQTDWIVVREVEEKPVLI